MVTWADADAAVETERVARIKRVENATLGTALLLLLCALWLAWPSMRGLINGEGVVLSSFGAPLLLIVWGIFVQDLTLDEALARSRVASATTVAWPPLLCLGALGLGEGTAQTAGSVLILLAGLACRQLSHRTMRGHFGVLRYRAILTGIGSLSAVALALTQGEGLDTVSGVVATVVCVLVWATRCAHGRWGTIKKSSESASKSAWMRWRSVSLNSRHKVKPSHRPPAC